MKTTNQAYHDRLTSIEVPFYRKLLSRIQKHGYIFSWSVDGNTNSLYLIYCHRRFDMIRQMFEILEPMMIYQEELAIEEGIDPSQLDVKIQIQELPDSSADAGVVHVGPCGIPDYLPAHPNIIIAGNWNYVSDRLKEVAESPHGKTIRSKM